MYGTINSHGQICILETVVTEWSKYETCHSDGILGSVDGCCVSLDGR
jgi:hypothetical protein